MHALLLLRWPAMYVHALRDLQETYTQSACMWTPPTPPSNYALPAAAPSALSCTTRRQPSVFLSAAGLHPAAAFTVDSAVQGPAATSRALRAAQVGLDGYHAAVNAGMDSSCSLHGWAAGSTINRGWLLLSGVCVAWQCTGQWLLCVVFLAAHGAVAIHMLHVASPQASTVAVWLLVVHMLVARPLQ
jgi:hypothetical protein